MNVNQFQMTHAGSPVHVEISPCSWMYPGYGLQIKLSLQPADCNAASCFANDKSLKATDVPMAKLLEMSRAFAARWLAENGLQPLKDAEAQWVKAMAEFAIEEAKEREREEKREARLIAKRKAEGFTHRIIAWIHPARGDDYQIEAFCKGEPTPADLKRLLAKSQIKNDFCVTAI